MKRWLTRILICLVLGTICTVSVAWALALTMPYLDWDAARILPVGKETPRWSIGTVRNLGALDIGAIVAWDVDWFRVIEESPVPGWSRAVHPPTSREAEIGTVISEYARGWPMLSLYWRGTSSLASQPPDWHTEWGWEIESLARFTKDHDSRTMPLAVIFPGFGLDTLFYAVIWFAMLFGLGDARRAIRRKRGRCVKCGYDLRGDLAAGCPECGWNRAEAES